MDIQTVMRDNYLLAVIEDLSREGLTTERIAKKNHLPYAGVLKAVDRLRAEGVVQEYDNGLALTAQGMELAHEIKGLERIPAGGADPKARSRVPDRLGPEDSRQRKENQGT
jgi:predicted methyltransferase